MAFQLLLDGCQITKLKNYETIPIIIVLLGLLPQLRYILNNILLSLLIPGPRKHKDLDSFLVPLITELKELSTGVQDIYNKHTNSQFTLYSHLVLV